ncbi:unnamed protein product [Calypogeia fissa]
MPRPGSPRTIRWRKGEIIGAGAYGRVYMGMNLDSGELLAVKQVLISVNNVTKEKAQAHIRELEEEVRLLQNLSHPNIVRYLGTAREDEALNILLEFVPGGSIASLLGKFGSFTESVIRMYTKQLLLGLEYLHSNNILHRDIKGGNILVDNKGCIKLADFGASKKVVELATISEAKSMKGTPYWMAPEVIRQTGHNWQADIWSVGCTVIEMATGKPPWSQQFQEVAALFHIGTTKSHPPIPEHLSAEAKNFLLKCLQREPKLRPSAGELLKHPFVTQRISQAAADGGRQSSADRSLAHENEQTTGRNQYSTLRNGSCRATEQYSSLRKGPVSFTRSHSFKPGSIREPQTNGRQVGTSFEPDSNCSVRLDSVRSDYNLDCSVRLDSVRNYPSSCGVRFDSGLGDDNNCSVRLDSLRSEYQPDVGIPSIRSEFLAESYNPMAEPSFRDGAGWAGVSHRKDSDLTFRTSNRSMGQGGAELQNGGGDSLVDDDDDVTESKIRAFLEEKALELKRLQSPLYEEYNNIWNTANENGPSESFIAPLSPSPAKHQSGTSSKSPTSKASSFSGGRSLGMRSSRDSEASVSSGSPNATGFPSVNFSPLLEVPSPRLNEWRGLLHDAQSQHTLPPPSPSMKSAERQRMWKEELQQELELKREEKRKMTRQASALSNSTQSPNKDKSLQRHGSRLGSTPSTPR